MVKKNKQVKNKHIPLLIILAAALLISTAVLGLAAYRASPPKQKIPDMPNHTLPYVDGAAATDQVANFYESYIESSRIPDHRQRTVAAFGSHNLEFLY